MNSLNRSQFDALMLDSRELMFVIGFAHMESECICTHGVGVGVPVDFQVWVEPLESCRSRFTQPLLISVCALLERGSRFMQWCLCGAVLPAGGRSCSCCVVSNGTEELRSHDIAFFNSCRLNADCTTQHRSSIQQHAQQCSAARKCDFESRICD